MRRGPERVRSPLAAQRGFTIIELMTVVAVMSVLLVIAISAYGDYTKRTRMMEVMLAASTCKNPVFEAFFYGHPPDPGGWGCEISGGYITYVDSVSVDENGKVTVIAQGFNDADIDGKAFTLQPLIDGAPAVFGGPHRKALLWRCGAEADGTTIPPQFLPASCR
jgi:type IV pilus assembly protein PilA